MKRPATFLLLLGAALPAPAQHQAGEEPTPAARMEGNGQAQNPWVSTDGYPLDTCIVSGRALGENPVLAEAAGRVFKLCSTGCKEKLAKDSASYAKKLDQAAIALQLPDYPLDRCPISDKKFGTAVKPVDLVLDGHLVRLCGAECANKAAARKAQIVATIEAAVYARQRERYPLSTCVSTGDPLLPETTVEVVHGTTLLRFGSKECLQDLDRRPAAFVKEVRAARAKTHPKDAGPASPRTFVTGLRGARLAARKPLSSQPDSLTPRTHT